MLGKLCLPGWDLFVTLPQVSPRIDPRVSLYIVHSLFIAEWRGIGQFVYPFTCWQILNFLKNWVFINKDWGPMHKDSCKNWYSFPLAASTAFTLARATFLPSHAAQRPGGAGKVWNTYDNIMAMIQVPLPAPSHLAPVYAYQPTIFVGLICIHTPDWLVGITKVQSICIFLFY